MYLASLLWSISTEWRWENVPRPESWPLRRTGVPSTSSVPNASASPVAQSMSRPVSMVLRFSCRRRAILGRLGDRRADFLEQVEIDRGLALAVLLARRDGEARPLALQPVGLVGLEVGRRLQRPVEVLAQRGVHGGDLGRAHHALLLQAGGVDFLHRPVAADLLVHQRLGEHRLVRFVVAVPAVAEHVDDDVALEALAELGGDARAVHHRLRVVAVHVQDRRLHDLGHLGAIGSRARVCRQRGEADLVVDHEVNGAADAIAAEVGEIERLRHQALACEGGVAVHEDRHDLAAVGVAPLVLLGARLAQYHRIHSFQMRGIGRQREMDDVAVEIAIGRGAEMVLHVARTAHLLGQRRAALELREQRGVALVHDVHEGVEAAAMRHADHHFLHAQLAAALEDLLDRGDQRFAAIEAEALGADELHMQVALEALRLDDALQDGPAALDGELGVVLDVLDPLLDPRPLVGVGDVQVFDTDPAAIGLAQAVHDLAQGRGVAQPERAEDQDGTVPVGLLEAVGRRIEVAMRRLAHQPERIEVGLEMAADAVAADQQEGARGVVGGGADRLLALPGERHRGGTVAALDVAVGGRARHLRVRNVDHARTARRPACAARLGEHVAALLGQRLEEGAPVGVDAARIREEARVQLFDERRIGAEQEGCLLRLHGPILPGLRRVVSPSLP
jgi:hypothetical protein